MNLELSEASLEISQKSDSEIEYETSAKWAARSVACYAKARATSGKESIMWLLRAEGYRHEALEHAALANGAETVNEVAAAMKAAAGD